MYSSIYAKENPVEREDDADIAFKLVEIEGIQTRHQIQTQYKKLLVLRPYHGSIFAANNG